MEPSIRIIEWETYGETVIHPVALVFTVLMGILTLVLDRKFALIPMILVVSFITFTQRIVIFNLDFDMLRIMIFFGLLRVIFRSEFRSIRINIIDKLFFSWVIFRTITNVIMMKSSDAFVYNLGFIYTAIGLYFIFRTLIRNLEDVKVIIKSLIIVSIPLALVMLNEQINGRNLFSILGGVPEFTPLRGGHLRSQASFSHPILAGSFGASLLPLAWGLWWQKGLSRLFAFLCACTATIIVFTSNSSGPILSYIGGFLFLILWLFRKQIRVILIGILSMMIGLSLVMNAPVWAIIWRVGIIGGSTGWHRYALIDQAIRRFGEWWLIGIPSSAHWGWGLQDVTNMYIAEGISGGIFPLLLFIAIIVFCFKTIGLYMKTDQDQYDLKLIWSLGGILFTHAVSFIGVSYFGKMMFFWYLPVAMISMIRNQFITKTVQNKIPILSTSR